VPAQSNDRIRIAAKAACFLSATVNCTPPGNSKNQHPSHVRPNRFLSTNIDRTTNKNYINTCPVLAGSHHDPLTMNNEMYP
ncbi:MAG: hypothetical protein ABSF34_05690, partial [Verrucomicrobiota bacterium]